MIKLQNYTPEIYYKESRDFQFIGRLFDLVLNSIKTEADLIYNIPLSLNSDEKLLELLTLTLGFKPKHQYNAQHLKAICSVFAEILKHKGSIKALKIACEALFNSMDIDQALDYDFTDGSRCRRRHRHRRFNWLLLSETFSSFFGYYPLFCRRRDAFCRGFRLDFTICGGWRQVGDPHHHCWRLCRGALSQFSG